MKFFIATLLAVSNAKGAASFVASKALRGRLIARPVMLSTATTPVPPSLMAGPEQPLRAMQPPSVALVSALRGGISVALPLVAGRDALCALVGLVGASLWLKIWTTLASKSFIDPKVSRKIVHSGSAPLFLITWPFFTNAANARVVAALVPIAFAARLVLASMGKQADLTKAISRTGSNSEALGGPFIYCCVLVALTLGSWRSAASVVALAQMAVGDGLADIVGRKYGKTKWPWSDSKSLAGTAAFVVGGFGASLGLMAWFGCSGAAPLGPLAALPLPALAARILGVSLVCGAVELLPLGDDNLTVPAAAVALILLLERFAS